MIPCFKCAGSGYVSPRLSRGCAGDVCFRCGGTGSIKAPRSKITKNRPTRLVKMMNCFAARWIVNGSQVSVGNFLHETIEGAQAEAATLSPAIGYYEAGEVNVADTPFNRQRLELGVKRFAA